MLSPDVRLSCRMDHKPGSKREQRRLQAIAELGLLESESVPVFEEATQTAAHFLDAPICILGVLDGDRHLFKSAVGLSRIGLMNTLARDRQMPRSESFCTHVVDSHQILAISDAAANPAFAHSLLVMRYGIRSYLGVPLLTSGGDCVGTLAIMGLETCDFTSREIQLLQLTARWSMSEFERDRLLKSSKTDSIAHFSHSVSNSLSNSPSPNTALSTSASAQVSLISQMTQELCTPLTSILGMASVLSQGVYGTLSDKQKEYLEIIHNSGRYLQSLVNEIVDLGGLDHSDSALNLNQVDIEMLSQQAIAALNQAACRRSQQIHLTVEPGNRIWLLDKDKVRQMLYHLVFCVVQSSSTDSIIRIHVSRRQNSLTFTIWTSHPWLGEGLPQAELAALNHLVGVSASRGLPEQLIPRLPNEPERNTDAVEADMITALASAPEEFNALRSDTRQRLGLLFSCQLAEVHGGSISIRGSVEDGYRYVIKLPQLHSSTAPN